MLRPDPTSLGESSGRGGAVAVMGSTEKDTTRGRPALLSTACSDSPRSASAGAPRSGSSMGPRKRRHPTTPPSLGRAGAGAGAGAGADAGADAGARARAADVGTARSNFERRAQATHTGNTATRDKLKRTRAIRVTRRTLPNPGA